MVNDVLKVNGLKAILLIPSAVMFNIALFCPEVPLGFLTFMDVLYNLLWASPFFILAVLYFFDLGEFKIDKTLSYVLNNFPVKREKPDRLGKWVDKLPPHKKEIFWTFLIISIILFFLVLQRGVEKNKAAALDLSTVWLFALITLLVVHLFSTVFNKVTSKLSRKFLGMLVFSFVIGTEYKWIATGQAVAIDLVDGRTVAGRLLFNLDKGCLVRTKANEHKLVLWPNIKEIAAVNGSTSK